MKRQKKTKGELPRKSKKIRERTATLEASERAKGREVALGNPGEDLLRILDSLQEVVVMIDSQGSLSYWNPAAERVFGYSAPEAIGKGFSLLLAGPEASQPFHKVVGLSTETGPRTSAGKTLELRALRKHGEEFPMEISLSVITLQGKWTALGIIQDISLRKQMIDSLSKSEGKYRLLVENANEAVLVAQDGVLKFANPKAVELFGYSLEELTNHPFTQFIHPEDRSLVAERHQRRLRGETLPHIYPFRIVHKDGGVRWAEINAVRFSWEDRPATLNFLADITWRRYAEEELKLHQDRLEELVAERTAELRRSIERLEEEITERRRAESEREGLIAELEAKNKELEQFTYTVSHDLKSPLITIRGFLGHLLKDMDQGDDARMRKDITRISNAAQRMERLLDELLSLSRIGHSLDALEEVPLRVLAEEAARIVAGQLRERGVRLEIALGLESVHGDRSRLLQVLQNLLDNAIKFLGDQRSPRVEIGARQSGGETVFYVRDNGMGMDSRHHESVFGLFEKLDHGSEGTGVGLTIVKRIVELHGGRIWVESEGLGKGCAFCFTLPKERPPRTRGK